MDIWDWIKGLRRWWWIPVVFPLIAGAIIWFTAPEPEYESTFTLNVVLDDPAVANSPAYFDFILLDDMDLLLQTGVLGDLMYLKLPEETQASLTRQEFGEMFESNRRARFVEIIVSGDDPELVGLVANTINENIEELTNFYLIPPTYAKGPAIVNTLDPVSEPALNSDSRLVRTGSIVGAVFLVSLAATGVTEWLRLSYSAKNSAK